MSNNPKIILYRMILPTHTCPFGLLAKRMLDDANLTFDDKILRSREEVDQLRRSMTSRPRRRSSLTVSGSEAARNWPAGSRTSKPLKLSRPAQFPLKRAAARGLADHRCDSARKRGGDDGHSGELHRASPQSAFVMAARLFPTLDLRPLGCRKLKARSLTCGHQFFDWNLMLCLQTRSIAFAPYNPRNDHMLAVPYLNDGPLSREMVAVDLEAARRDVQNAGIAPTTACTHARRKDQWAAEWTRSLLAKRLGSHGCRLAAIRLLTL